MATKPNSKKRAMIEALEKSLGIVSTAAKKIGINRCTHYKWLEEDPQYKQQVDSIDNAALDLAESKLHARIRSGDTIAIIFFLKTKGKKRGYIEKQELAITEAPPLARIQLTKEEIKQYSDALEEEY